MENLQPQPKKTFYNLSLEKRQKIEAVLVDEFATKGYQKASLNSIVNSLGIAKGSLYQYFDNKESMFLYVFSQFTSLVKKSVKKPAPHDGTSIDFWKEVNSVIRAGIGFIEQHPKYFQLYLHVQYEEKIPYRDHLIKHVRLFSKEYFGPMVEWFQSNGVFIQSPVTTIIFILDAVMDRFLQGYARNYIDDGLELRKKNLADIDREIEQIIQTLKLGIVIRK